MNFDGFAALLAMAPASAPGTVPDPKAQTLQMLGMLVFMAVVMYVVMIRPQQKKAKEHTELLKALKSGDKVLTSGGILCVVVTVKEKSVTIRSGDTKLELLKSAVSEITEKAGAAA